jgi:aspartyl-tRNA(Asn)/glutamyl-tRNA(Gln) amidotransferase subunit C
MIDEKDVFHMGKLARIELGAGEVKRFAKDLSAVFEYMEVLNELETDNLPEISQVNGLSNVLGEDLVVASDCLPADLLSQSPNPVELNQIKVSKVV